MNRGSLHNEVGQNGQTEENLFGFIPRDHVLMDLLHCAMRLTERKLATVINDLIKNDMATRRTSSALIDLFEHVGGLVSKATGLNVRFRLQEEGVDNNSALYSMSPMSGTHLRKLDMHLDVLALYRRPCNLAGVTEGVPARANAMRGWWNKLTDVYIYAHNGLGEQQHANHSGYTPLQHTEHARRLLFYSTCTTTPDIDPMDADYSHPLAPGFMGSVYAHALVFHAIPQMLPYVKELKSASCQMLEKANKDHHVAWLNTSNKHKNIEDLCVMLGSFRKILNPACIERTKVSCRSCHKGFTYLGRLATHLRKFCTEHKDFGLNVWTNWETMDCHQFIVDPPPATVQQLSLY
jgi:hypothetical protein